jgi:hypothetical protein
MKNEMVIALISLSIPDENLHKISVYAINRTICQKIREIYRLYRSGNETV